LELLLLENHLFFGVAFGDDFGEFLVGFVGVVALLVKEVTGDVFGLGVVGFVGVVVGVGCLFGSSFFGVFGPRINFCRFETAISFIPVVNSSSDFISTPSSAVKSFLTGADCFNFEVIAAKRSSHVDGTIKTAGFDEVPFA